MADIDIILNLNLKSLSFTFYCELLHFSVVSIQVFGFLTFAPFLSPSTGPSPSPASPPFLCSFRLDSKLYKYDDGNNTILYILLYHPDLDHKPSLAKYKIPKPFLPPLPQLPPSQYPVTTQQKMVELLRIRDDRRGFSGQPLKVTFWVFFIRVLGPEICQIGKINKWTFRKSIYFHIDILDSFWYRFCDGNIWQ